MRSVPNMPKKFEKWLSFEYGDDDEEIEVKVSFQIYGDDGDDDELDLDIIENDTKFSDDELIDYIYNSQKLCDEIFDSESSQIQAYIDGYDDYLADQAESRYK